MSGHDGAIRILEASRREAYSQMIHLDHGFAALTAELAQNNAARAKLQKEIKSAEEAITTLGGTLSDKSEE